MSLFTPSDPSPDLNTPVSELETPAVVVDLNVMERNIERYAALAEKRSVSLRSHAKTHKIPDIAHQQHRRTGGGILCQTLGEVEVMAASGLDDIYLSYQTVGRRKLDKLVALSTKLDSFATTVDGPANIEPLQAAAKRQDTTVHAVLEVDVGLGRTGVEPGEPAVEMARLINEQPDLTYDGIMAYEAHVKRSADSESEYEQHCEAVMEEVAVTVDSIEDASIGVREVKVGGTATSPYSSSHSVVTEINPGQYVFNDVSEIESRPWAVGTDDCALTVLSTAISTQVTDRTIVDAGSKTISMDTDRLPVPKNRENLVYESYSEEHGHLDTSEVETPIEVGDHVEFVPPHICSTVNLHDTLIGARDGVVEELWEVQARGKVR